NKGDATGVVAVVGGPVIKPAAKRRQAGHGHHVTLADQPPTVVVLQLLDFLGDFGPVVAAGNRVVAEAPVAVEGQHARARLGTLVTRYEQVDRQRRVAAAGQDKLFAVMVLQVNNSLHRRLPRRGWLVGPQ